MHKNPYIQQSDSNTGENLQFIQLKTLNIHQFTSKSKMIHNFLILLLVSHSLELLCQCLSKILLVFQKVFGTAPFAQLYHILALLQLSFMN